MVGSLWTGISGLSGSQTALDNESNNIANVNTIGYKSSRISFTDQMYQAKIGKGVTSFDVEKMYTQGNLKLTGVSYDMALSSDGFFVASNGKETFYSRAGNFRMGESGTLEDVGKNHIQGWAMQPLQEDNIVSTDPNATRFTDSFTKVIGNKIIRDSGSIETIIAKATDYTATAVSDTVVELQYSEVVTPTWWTAWDWDATWITSSAAAQNTDTTIVDLTVNALWNTAFTVADFALTINDDGSDKIVPPENRKKNHGKNK